MSGEKNTPANLADEDDEDFIQRWARRKAEAEAAGEVADAETQAATPSSSAEEDKQAPSTDEPSPALTDADMLPLDSLNGDSDVSAFFSQGVSESLRRSALRKLFHSPKFNVCDGLDDYCDDFTNFPALGDIVTADMRHQMMRKLERLAALDESTDETTEKATDETTGAAAEQPGPIAEIGDEADSSVNSLDSEDPGVAAVDGKNKQDPTDPGVTEEKHDV